jgi:DNA-binding transcriptional LysR family regulator
MTISMLSRRLSVLESELGVPLVKRSTRRVTLTAQRTDYLSECQEPLNHLQEAEGVLTQTRKKPEGLLRITAAIMPASSGAPPAPAGIVEMGHAARA